MVRFWGHRSSRRLKQGMAPADTPDVLAIRLVLGMIFVGVLLAGSTQADAAQVSGCGTVTVTYPDGTQRTRLTPPTPTGTLTRLRNGRFRFTWRFASLPSECRPTQIVLGLKLKPPLTFIPFHTPVRARSGARTVLRLPASLTDEVAYGVLTAEMANGSRSKSRRVPLRRA